jgi:uncharacterized protein YfdQ (DUF2303 family)
VAGFCDYVNRFATPDTTIFANEDAGRIVAVLDYHAPDAPSWATHKGTLVLQPAPEWEAWLPKNGTLLPQQNFAEWLEDHAADIVDPSAGRLTDVVTNLTLNREVSFTGKFSLDSGTCRFGYSETDKPGEGSIAVPTRFTLRLRRYLGQDPIDVRARLRHRLERGKIGFIFLIDRLDQVEEQQFAAVCAQIAATTQRLVLIGTP